jgi:hypothetical protein
MNRKIWQILIGLMWLALPAIAIRYRLTWDHLPRRMATHFNAANQPNGWMTRETSLTFSLVTLAFLLTVFSLVLYVIHQKYGDRKFSWSLLAFFYFVTGFAYAMSNAVLDYNLYGRPIHLMPFVIGMPLAIIALLAIYLGSQRGAPLPVTDLIAEEVHASVGWAMCFLIPLLALSSLLVIGPRMVRTVVGLVLLVLIPCFAMAWNGFHYRFTRHGLEIRVLGFRLKSIPFDHINQYSIDSWNVLGGYGIRGLGNNRAYVWGNKGVRVKTTDGDVFLGHSQPERIVHDLDAMKQLAHYRL